MFSCTHAIAAGGSNCNAVDLYNSATGAWTTAQLSEARQVLSAASGGKMAIFAGGYKSGALWWRKEALWERGLRVFCWM